MILLRLHQVNHKIYVFLARFPQFHYTDSTLLIYIDGLVQDCINSIANILELLQPCTKPSVYFCVHEFHLMTHVFSICHVYIQIDEYDTIYYILGSSEV